MENIDGVFINLLFVFLGTTPKVYQEHKLNEAADDRIAFAYLIVTELVKRPLSGFVSKR